MQWSLPELGQAPLTLSCSWIRRAPAGKPADSVDSHKPTIVSLVARGPRGRRLSELTRAPPIGSRLAVCGATRSDGKARSPRSSAQCGFRLARWTPKARLVEEDQCHFTEA